MSNVKEEIEEIRRELSRISGEVETLKEGREKPSSEVLQGLPEDVGKYLGLLEKQLADKPDAGIAYFGGIGKRGGKLAWSYHSGYGVEDVLKCPPRRVASLLSPFSNEQRILILKALIEGDKGSSELSQATRLEGGQLYHHLKELALAEYIEQKERGVYALADKGRMALLTVLAMTMTLEKRVTPEEIETIFQESRKEGK